MYEQWLYGCFTALCVNGEARIALFPDKRTLKYSIRMVASKPGYCEIYLTGR